MIIQIPFSFQRANEPVNVSISFHSGIVKVFVERGNYIVKWFRDNELYGEMELFGGYWGSFPQKEELKDWHFEFWKDGDLLYKHYCPVNSSNVLLVPVERRLNKMEIKTLVVNEAKKLQFLGANVWVYVRNSHEYDFSPYDINPLRLSDSPLMDFILDI